MKNANDYAKNCLKPPKAFFEWCYCNMPTYKWENKKKTIIGSERKHCYTNKKRLAKNSRLTFFDRKDYFKIILSTKKRIEIQTYAVASIFNKGKQEFIVNLHNLEVFSEDKHLKIGHKYNENYKFGLVPNGFSLSYWCRPSIYPNEWLKRLCEVSELRYLTLDELDAEKVAFVYKYRKRIEFAQRIGAPGLAKDIIDGRFDMRILTPKWLKKHKPFFKNSDRDLNALKLKNHLESKGIKYITGVEKYLYYKEIDKFPEGIKAVTFQNYLIKQQCSIHFYWDYIRLINELKRPITSKKRFPKNLKNAHDEAVDTLNTMNREIEKVKFTNRAIEQEFLEIKFDDIQFILPKDAKEIVNEGKTLKHCVGGVHYIRGHGDGDFTIVFIRKNDEPTVPYFTLEYKEGKIVQNHGYDHEKPDEELKKKIEKWLKVVNQKKNRKDRKYVA
ncbi:hypothetical protein B834_1685 [Enterococcus mundtii 1A]|uniref:PcfJ domain-containing protein n=1 Tax=Enterococcus mundtii TaxID=53346 RepID=UPI002302B577|nr:PcfJ domain-containing protein [Enterococcus mundtii]MDA9429190.1 hypothetical protein [Enterococcus mundtii 1A]